MGGEFFFVGLNDHGLSVLRPLKFHGFLSARTLGRAAIFTQLERALPTRHGEVNIGQDARIDQRTVQVALGVVDAVALAERIEAVALPGVEFSGERQGVEHGAAGLERCGLGIETLELGVQKSEIEGRVMNDKLGALNELQQLLDHLSELGLTLELGERKAVDRRGALVDLALRVLIFMKLPPREATPHEFETADFDDAMPLADFEARSFGVENDLAHGDEV